MCEIGHSACANWRFLLCALGPLGCAANDESGCVRGQPRLWHSASLVRREWVALAHWVFGYGSLLWRVDFPYQECRRAHIRGWSRRFWQASRDHRGTPQAPGRVVTLIARPGEQCDGLVYRVEENSLARLDHREKDGYQRIAVDIHTTRGPLPGITYVAPPGNPGYLGPRRLDEMARQILEAAGASGRNLDYLRELAEALLRLGVADSHVAALTERAKALGARPAPTARPRTTAQRA